MASFPSTQSIWLFQRHIGFALTSLGGVTAGPSSVSRLGGFLGPPLQTSVCVTIASGWCLGLAGRRSSQGSAKKLTVKSCATTAEVLTHHSSSDPLSPFLFLYLSIFLSICLTVFLPHFGFSKKYQKDRLRKVFLCMLCFYLAKWS